LLKPLATVTTLIKGGTVYVLPSGEVPGAEVLLRSSANGFVLAIVMGRLGRSPFAWGLLGLLLGPVALLLALVEVRNERPWWTRLVASGESGSGPVDVLVGIDGSPESAAATTAALELLGDRVGRLTLVAVTDLDDSYAGREERVRLQGELERQAEAVRVWLREQDGPVQAKQTVVPRAPADGGSARHHPRHHCRPGWL
jgi:hypothetical protein